MDLSTYLTFDGNCRDAFEFYRSVFGGDYHVFSTFADSPSGDGIAAADKNKVMHVSLPIGDSVLMGSDSLAVEPASANGQQLLALCGREQPHAR